MKKILSLILGLAVVLCALPFGVVTVNAATSGYYTYTVSNGEATITDCNTSISGDVTLPSTLGGYPVTSIGTEAFYWCDSLTSITIPDGVTSIGDYAFKDCGSLTYITIPDSVKSIGNKAFSWCGSLTSITIPDGVTSISDYAFNYCSSLTSITIPDGVTSIGDYAFEGCRSLTYITIPDSVKSIGDNAFENCSKLTSITVNKNNTVYCSINGILFNKKKTTIICYPEGKTDKSYTIPDSVKSIGNSAFSWCGSLTSITIPDGVTSIGDNAFDYCSSLTSITIPGSVTSIGDYAFDGCRKLNTVYYCGTKSEWNKISIESNNSYLKNATRFYHLYDNDCDTTCNICGDIRLAHVYDNDCDTTCNICGDIRITEHIYDNGCDTTCNICGDNRITEHIYDNDCDTTCNICENVRTIEHNYSNLGKCTVCGEFIESAHDYTEETDQTWVITKENSASIKIFFSAETFTEKDWDFIYIYDGKDNEIGKYTGDELASKSVTVSSDTTKVRLVSDRMNNAYGFKVTSIEFTCAHDYEIEIKNTTCTEDGYKKHICKHCGDIYITDEVYAFGHIYENGNCVYCDKYLETEHDYENLFDETWVISRENAKKITITFSPETYIEQRYDLIYIYDGEDNEIGKYTGEELASKSVTVSGDTAKIRLITDRIGTAYGFAITDISAQYSNDLNGDGEINSADVVIMKKAILGVTELTEDEIIACDINGDGTTNILDLIALKKIIAK